MKYISLTAIVAIALVIAWFILNPNNSSDYVVMVNDDVSALEAELVAVEAQVQAGTLSPAAASEARGRIINRINAIEASAAASGKAELTVGQRQQLSDGLDRLKNILLTYQATLVTVESTAAVSTKTNNSDQTLTGLVADTIDSFEAAVTEVDDSYEADAGVDAAIDAAVDDAETMNNDDTSNTTEADDTTDDITLDDSQTSDDSATTTEEDTVIDVSGTTTVDLIPEDPSS